MPGFTTLELSGSRRTIRHVTAWALAVCSLIAGLAYLLSSHQVRDGAWRSYFDDGGVFPLVVLFLVLNVTVLLRNRRFGSGMLTGVIAAFGAFFASMPILFPHMLYCEKQHSNSVDHVLGISMFGLLFGGIALLFGESILYLIERHCRVRALRPQLPVARVMKAAANGTGSR